jgi:signal transduction histidine kinase/phage shock protein PspC (stress-responsive transcriptional regulator)
MQGETDTAMAPQSDPAPHARVSPGAGCTTDEPARPPAPNGAGETSDAATHGSLAGTGAKRGRTDPWHLFTRSRSDRVLVGVAGGLAARAGADPLLIRLSLAVLTLANGLGVVLYLMAWALSAEPDADQPATAPARVAPRPRQIVAMGAIVLGGLLVTRDLGLWLGDAFVWPVALVASGSAVIWARSDESDRARWTQVGARLPGNPVEAVFAGRTSPLRVAVGGLLVAGGVAIFLAANQALAAARTAVLAIVVTTAGLAIILGPWILRLARQAGEERRRRIRSEERAEIAAHLHDSVLHTLALIERSDVAPELVSLARRQERDLRAWLNGRPPGEAATDLRGAIDALASHVEQHYRVVVDAVVVGDAVVDARMQALVLSLQEAAVNAARHSGAAHISVYVEVEDDVVTAFVRDQGSGFVPDAVPTDRRGIAESIAGRMRRQGGSAAIHSQPGDGTEVQLTMPRKGP